MVKSHSAYTKALRQVCVCSGRGSLLWLPHPLVALVLLSHKCVDTHTCIFFLNRRSVAVLDPGNPSSCPFGPRILSLLSSKTLLQQSPVCPYLQPFLLYPSVIHMSKFLPFQTKPTFVLHLPPATAHHSPTLPP